MPAGDRSGPSGEGPRSGRAAGYCGGSSTPGYMNPYPGRGLGRGSGMGFGGGRGMRRGGGRGGGRGAGWTPSPEGPSGRTQAVPEERHWLEGQVKALQQQLKDIVSRLRGLERGSSEREE